MVGRDVNGYMAIGSLQETAGILEHHRYIFNDGFTNTGNTLTLE